MSDADILLHGGLVIDGTGNTAVRADLAIADGRIRAMGRLSQVSADRVVDVGGLILCPGFIDMHAHSDLRVLTDQQHLAKVAQGITTEVLGQDGLGYAPVDDRILPALRNQLLGWNGNPHGLDWRWRSVHEYLETARGRIAVNIAYLVPHGNLRLLAMEDPSRAATGDELCRMGEVLRTSMRDGAVGLSTGLTYTPALFADDDELRYLARIVREEGGYYAPHHRGYGSYAMQEYAACIRLAEDTGVPVHLTHAQLGFPINEGRAPELLEMIDAAIATGAEVTMDSYPFTASSTYLRAILPSWAQTGSHEECVARLRDPEVRERMRIEIEDTGHPAYHDVPVDWGTVVVSGVAHTENEEYVGRTIAESAQLRGAASIDVFCDLLAKDALGTTCIQHVGNEDNVRAIMQHRNHMGGSDGILVGAKPHPRGWSTFPRYLRHYARDTRVLRLEDAVRKFTSLPAQRLGFWDRGVLRPGLWADIVAIDLEALSVRSSYETPSVTPDGIPHVLVNGRLVIDGGERTSVTPGVPLRKAVG